MDVRCLILGCLALGAAPVIAAEHGDHAPPAHEPAAAADPHAAVPSPPAAHGHGAAPAATAADPAPVAPIAAAAAAAAVVHPGEALAQGLSGRQALDRMVAGNKRFMADLTSLAHHGAVRREAVAAHQHPVAVVVCCSDSRVPPEQLFDQGLGDLFVVRTAGNVVDAIALGSIEYACEHLHTPLVVVLGHERCGAVTAAAGTATPVGRVQAVVDAIRANTAATRPADGGTVEQAVLVNAKAVAQQIAACTPIIEGLVRSEEVLVVAARYDLDTGEVSLIP